MRNARSGNLVKSCPAREVTSMNTRMTVLTASLLLASAPPAFSGDGYYVGLGAGWDSQNSLTIDQLRPPFASAQLDTNDGLIVAGTVGYKLPVIPIRLEFESGYDWHTASLFHIGGATFRASGRTNIASELFNALYDLPVAPGWNLYAGAGIGPGHVYSALTTAWVGPPEPTGFQAAYVDHWALMWQLIAGASFEVTPDANIFVDYRYRDARARGTVFGTPLGALDSKGVSENVILAGVRFYLFPI
jgi:opacity protein-like surface antigen